MRRKMAAMSSMSSAAPSSPMEESPTPESAPAPDDSEQPTAFLPKELGGGKVWKPGDEIVLRVKAVDPETGEMQVEYAPEKPGEPDEPSDSMEAMDEAMPETSDGGY